jgi:hypothetical protein
MSSPPSPQNPYINALVIGVTFVVFCVLFAALVDLESLLGVLSVLAPTVELLGALVAAFPDVRVLGRTPAGTRRVRQIDTAMDALADRDTTIDSSTAGFEEVAAQMVEDLDIDHPQTIRSTPVVGTFVIDGADVASFSTNSMNRRARAIEQEEQQRFQVLGLQILAGGFAVQLVAAVLRYLVL